MSEPINLPPDNAFLSDDEKQLFSQPHTAKFRLFQNGKFFPVGRMFGADGQIVTNPLHAFGCIAFSEQWAMMSCHPGDIEPIREGRPWIWA
jgi:hypothetical protein